MFDLIRDISDPEHPLSLEQLNIVQARCSSSRCPPPPHAPAAEQNMGRRRQQPSGGGVRAHHSALQVACDVLCDLQHVALRFNCCCSASTLIGLSIRIKLQVPFP